MTPVQMESSARPCTECDGRGYMTVRGCSHQGACPCGEWTQVACPRCEGSKVEACTSCGEPSTLRYLGEDWCNHCAPAEEYRFSCCSICERPIDVRESRVPLCPSCEGTAREAGRQAADAWRYERGAA